MSQICNKLNKKLKDLLKNKSHNRAKNKKNFLINGMNKEGKELNRDSDPKFKMK